MRNNIIKVIFILLSLLLCGTMNAQYIGEIGVLGGVSYYNGDLNSTTPFVENNLLLGGMLRLHASPRHEFKIDIAKGKVSGNTDNLEVMLPNNEFGYDYYEFERDFWDMGLQYELNFFRYGPDTWDKEIYCYTPYVLLGPGITKFDQGSKNRYAFNVAVGVGFKYKFLQRFNVGVEWSMRKLFIDDFDVTGLANKQLDNPYKQETSSLKNNDWYSFAFLYLSIDIVKRRGRCTEIR